MHHINCVTEFKLLASLMQFTVFLWKLILPVYVAQLLHESNLIYLLPWECISSIVLPYCQTQLSRAYRIVLMTKLRKWKFPKQTSS